MFVFSIYHTNTMQLQVIGNMKKPQSLWHNVHWSHSCECKMDDLASACEDILKELYNQQRADRGGKRQIDGVKDTINLVLQMHLLQ